MCVVITTTSRRVIIIIIIIAIAVADCSRGTNEIIKHNGLDRMRSAWTAQWKPQTAWCARVRRKKSLTSYTAVKIPRVTLYGITYGCVGAAATAAVERGVLYTRVLLYVIFVCLCASRRYTFWVACRQTICLYATVASFYVQ